MKQQKLGGIALISLLVLLAFSGCIDDKPIGPVAIKSGQSQFANLTRLPKSTLDTSTINRSLDVLAVSTARALKSREFREVIEAEIAKRFDGDYDALFKNIYHKKLSDGVSFVEHIAMAYASLHRHLGEKVGAAAALQAIADAAGRVLKFQIAVPVHFEHWDAGSYVPLVTYVPEGIDEKDLVKLKAYDFDGKVYWLDAKKAPNAPVVVLGINERTDESGNVKAYTLPPDDGGGGGGGGGGTTYVFRATSLTVGRDYEGWFDGDMEIYFKLWYAGDWHEVQQDQSYSIDVILRQFSDPSAGT